MAYLGKGESSTQILTSTHLFNEVNEFNETDLNSDSSSSMDVMELCRHFLYCVLSWVFLTPEV